MCGFAGVISFDDRYRVTPGLLEQMGRAIAHRGPDGHGLYFNHENAIDENHPQVGLVFRRLAILDPDPRSNQPFTDGRHWMVFNGEIYNFRELKKELTALRPDYQWRTTGDTEVLLCAYAVWGENCVEHLNGMFAIAVWDAVDRTLFLARDRMGQKPLYWAALGSAPFLTIVFASEVGAIDSLNWLDREVDQTAIANYLRLGYLSGQETAFEACIELRPATRLTFLKQAIISEKVYFDPNCAPTLSPDPVSVTRHLVRQAVQRQLVSDVPLGVFLSGGVDSSVIAACARQHGPVKTFCISFDDARYDESEHAAAVARHLGTDHHVFRVTPQAAIDLLQLAVVFGTPFADSSALPTHYLARETCSHVKVALSGDGGDELFGGYERYRAMRLGRHVRAWHLEPLLRWGRITQYGSPKSVLTKAGRFIASLGQSETTRYESYMRLFDEPTLAALWPGAPQPVEQDSIARRYYLSRTYLDEVQAALAVDRVTYLPADLLTKVDRCSMLHGLEVRSPFMDHELVQFAAGLTTDQLLKGGPKRMLREAFAADLPAWVFKRKKMGFAVPIGDWFRGSLRSLLTDTLFAADSFSRGHFDMKFVQTLVDQHQNQMRDHSQRLYALLMLELWWTNCKSLHPAS